MKKTLLILFPALFSTQIFAQKEAQEFPWSKAAKIIEADEAKAPVRKKSDRLPPEADTKKPGKKMDKENKKDK